MAAAAAAAVVAVAVAAAVVGRRLSGGSEAVQMVLPMLLLRAEVPTQQGQAILCFVRPLCRLDRRLEQTTDGVRRIALIQLPHPRCRCKLC